MTVGTLPEIVLNSVLTSSGAVTLTSVNIDETLGTIVAKVVEPGVVSVICKDVIASCDVVMPSAGMLISVASVSLIELVTRALTTPVGGTPVPCSSVIATVSVADVTDTSPELVIMTTEESSDSKPVPVESVSELSPLSIVWPGLSRSVAVRPVMYGVVSAYSPGELMKGVAEGTELMYCVSDGVT